MNRRLMDFICCPDCQSDLRLEPKDSDQSSVQSGTIHCDKCNSHFPIVNGIPRFLPNMQSPEDVRKVYADSFGHQWTTYQWLRDVDSQEFYGITDFTPATFEEKVVLDAGCGGGRVARFIAPLCKDFIGLDFSIAVEKAAELCAGNPNAHFIQCDINRHPLKPGLFDVVYSHGVIHHTGDSKKAFDKLPPLVKDGGLFYIAVFRKSWEPLQWSDTFWRNILNKLPISVMDKVCDVMSYMKFLPGARFLKRFFWFSLERTKEIRKCCLYDWYGPTYHQEHTVEEVFGWFMESGFPEPKYIDAWPYCPAERKYVIPTKKDEFRLGQLLGVVATKRRAGANGERHVEALASTSA